MDQREREREIGSAPLFCSDQLRPNFLINEALTRVWVSLFAVQGDYSNCQAHLLTLGETTGIVYCCPRSMQMKKGHYQQKDLDQEVISVGKEEGNSMQGMEDPLEDSLETPCYFQEDQWSKQPKY